MTAFLRRLMGLGLGLAVDGGWAFESSKSTLRRTRSSFSALSVTWRIRPLDLLRSGGEGEGEESALALALHLGDCTTTIIYIQQPKPKPMIVLLFMQYNTQYNYERSLLFGLVRFGSVFVMYCCTCC